MSVLASVLVDVSTGEGGSVKTEVTDFSSLGLAQDYSALLAAEWAEEGWTKRHEVWVKGKEWRQKLLVVGGVR